MSTIDYTPQTDRGTGVLIPAAKALGHLMIVHQAISNGWTITQESVRAEMEEAVTHIEDIMIRDNLLTEKTVADVEAWKTAIREQIQLLSQNLKTPEDLDKPADSTTITDLQGLVQNTWATLSLLDRELTDLRGVDADPGKLP